MDFGRDTNWFAIQAKPHQESLAAASVARLDLEVFLPRIRCEQYVCGVSRAVSKPLFVGYFFARFCPVISFDSVRYTWGVLRVLGTGAGPIPLGDEVISSIKQRVASDGFIPLVSKSFAVGEKVEILEGPFAGWMAEVEREWDDGKRVSILLEVINKARLLIGKHCLEKSRVA